MRRGRVPLSLAIAGSAYFAGLVGYYAVACGSDTVGMAIVGAIGLFLALPAVAAAIFIALALGTFTIAFGFFNEGRQFSALWLLLLVPAVGLLSFLASSLLGARPRCSVLW
jgi:hypothetical protein